MYVEKPCSGSPGPGFVVDVDALWAELARLRDGE
jgi:hypothetical protein